MKTYTYTQSEIGELKTQHGSLSEIILQLETDLKKQASVLCQIVVNDLEFRIEDETKYADLKSGEIERLSIKFDDTLQVMNDVMDQWLEQIPRMIKLCDQLSDKFRFETKVDSYKPLVDLIDSCQMLIDSLMAYEQLQKDQSSFPAAEWVQNALAMSQAVGHCLESFQKKDGSSLADILEYDLPHTLQVWHNLLVKATGKA